ncbi:MAG: hypothetical protein K6C10_04505 [Prevotella sp.]|nr:hypothetical protein [Prevotella sp.]
MKKIFILMSAMLLVSGVLMAKNKKNAPMPQRVTYMQMTEQMEKNLGLGAMQLKKVLKLNKKYKTLIEGEEMNMNGQPPMGGMPSGNASRPNGGGMGGPGGMPGGGNFGGGMPGGGNFGGGMPGGGNFGGGMPGGAPRGGMGMPSENSSKASYDYEKKQKKYDKAIAKILTTEQYEGYLKLKPQFASQRKNMPMPPGGGKNMQMPPGGGHNQQKEGSISATGLGLQTGPQVRSRETFSSSGVDENAVQVKGGTLTLENCHVNKTGGDSSNGDATSFYGVNSAVVTTGEGVANIVGGDITTDAVGANGVVAYGGRVDISGTTITCNKNLSRGIHATGGGVINASNLKIVTCGNNSSVIATDRGGGTVTVEGGTYKTSGKDCAVCYSTGIITVNNIQGLSEQGEIAVIEGDNEVNIIESEMKSGDNRRGMMILQSGSGDAEGYNGKINVTGGHLTLKSQEAPLIEITTSTKGTLTLKDTKIEVPSGILMLVDYNKRWKTTNPVATLNLQTDSEATYAGDIKVDEYGTSTVVVDKNVTWNGAYDKAGTGKKTKVVVDGIWNLTGDSHVKEVVLNEGGVINRNGFQLITE